MVMKTTRPSDVRTILGVIDPEAQGAATVRSDWVSMKDFNVAVATICVGEMAASSTVDAKFEQATDSSGTGAKDVTGKAITQMTQAGSDDDKQREIEICGEDLDVDNDFTHVRLSMTVAAAASDICGIVQGFGPRYGPASDKKLASLDEIIGLDA